MFEKVYKNCLEVGKIIKEFKVPTWYELPSENTVAVISTIVNFANSDYETNIWYIYYTDENIIVLATSNAPSQILYNDGVLLNGKIRQLIVVKSNSNNTGDQCIALASLLMTLNLNEIKASTFDHLVEPSISRNIVNLYSTAILMVKLFDVLDFGDDENILKYVRAAYSDVIKDNFTLNTIISIRKLLFEQSIAELLDNSVVFVIYANYSKLEFKDNYPDFKIDIKSDNNQSVDDFEDDELDSSDLCEFTFKIPNDDTIYKLLQCNDDLHKYIDDPEHYTIYYATEDTLSVNPLESYRSTVIMSKTASVALDCISEQSPTGETIIDINKIILNRFDYPNLAPSVEELMAWVDEYEDISISKLRLKDISPLTFSIGNETTLYHAISCDDNLSNYMDIPDGYQMWYIRLDDNGAGEMATFETKPVVVNKGGTLLVSNNTSEVLYRFAVKEYSNAYVVCDALNFEHESNLKCDNDSDIIRPMLQWLVTE